VDERRYKGFFMMFPTSRMYNRLYNLMVMFCKALMVITIMIGNSIFKETGIIFVALFFIANEVV